MSDRPDLVEVAHKVLLGWHLSTIKQADDLDLGYPLLDAVSEPNRSVASGEIELGEIAFAIIAAVEPIIRADEAAKGATSLDAVFEQAKFNHETYSATGSNEEDIRFFALGLAGEAGEVANFVKKRWRDGDEYIAELRAECADVFAYNIMLAWALGMQPARLLAEVARKQLVFVEKMQAIKDRGNA